MAVTVSLKAGRWYASFTVEEDVPAPAKRPGPTVGIDMGLKTLAVVSDGEIETAYANPRLLQQVLKERRTLDKAIARSQKAHGKTNPSKRRDHLYELRCHRHARIAGLRADHHHRITTAIANQGGTVKVETLRVAGMSKAYGRSVADAGLAEFLRQLEYKCMLYGTEFVKAPWDFVSTKTCSRCGCRKPPDGMPIWERTFRCDCCGLILDRDRNAVRNLPAFPGEIGAPVNCARRRHKTAGLPGRTARDVRNSASVSP